MQKSLGKRARIAALAISRQVERHNGNENENENEDGLKHDKAGKGEWQNTQRKTKRQKLEIRPCAMHFAIASVRKPHGLRGF